MQPPRHAHPAARKSLASPSATSCRALLPSTRPSGPLPGGEKLLPTPNLPTPTLPGGKKLLPTTKSTGEKRFFELRAGGAEPSAVSNAWVCEARLAAAAHLESAARPPTDNVPREGFVYILHGGCALPDFGCKHVLELREAVGSLRAQRLSGRPIAVLSDGAIPSAWLKSTLEVDYVATLTPVRLNCPRNALSATLNDKNQTQDPTTEPHGAIHSAWLKLALGVDYMAALTQVRLQHTPTPTTNNQPKLTNRGNIRRRDSLGPAQVDPRGGLRRNHYPGAPATKTASATPNHKTK